MSRVGSLRIKRCWKCDTVSHSSGIWLVVIMITGNINVSLVIHPTKLLHRNPDVYLPLSLNINDPAKITTTYTAQNTGHTLFGL